MPGGYILLDICGISIQMRWIIFQEWPVQQSSGAINKQRRHAWHDIPRHRQPQMLVDPFWIERHISYILNQKYPINMPVLEDFWMTVYKSWIHDQRTSVCPAVWIAEILTVTRMKGEGFIDCFRYYDSSDNISELSINLWAKPLMYLLLKMISVPGSSMTDKMARDDLGKVLAPSVSWLWGSNQRALHAP